MTAITLAITEEDGRVTRASIPEGSYIIGRDPSCDIVLSSPSVSRRHARITVTEDELDVEDLGSRCGTTLEHLPIRSSTRMPLPVVLRFAHIEVKVFSTHRPLAPEAHYQEELHEESQHPYRLENSIALDHRPRPELNVSGLNEQTRQRLEMLYELPLQFAAESQLDRLCHLIIHKVIELTPGAVRGALLIKNPHDGKLSLRASIPASFPPISRTLIRKAALEQTGFIWEGKEAEREDVSASMAAIHIRTGMYAPLVWKGETLGVLLVDNPNRRTAFTREDLQFLLSVAHYAASAVEIRLLQSEINQNSRTLQNLLTNFSPKIRNRLLAKSRMGRLQPGGEKSEVTVLFADLREFTVTSAGLSAEAVVEMLNSYFHVLGEVVFRHDGTIDKFVGDALIAVFGSPEPDPFHAWHAVCAALEMQQQMESLNESRVNAGLPVCHLGIGINTGEVLHGFIGAEERLEFTIIGDAVNKTSRYCDAAGPGTILLGPSTQAAIGDWIATEPCCIYSKHEGELSVFLLDWRNVEPGGDAGVGGV